MYTLLVFGNPFPETRVVTPSTQPTGVPLTLGKHDRENHVCIVVAMRRPRGANWYTALIGKTHFSPAPTTTDHLDVHTENSDKRSASTTAEDFHEARHETGLTEFRPRVVATFRACTTRVAACQMMVPGVAHSARRTLICSF
jgi:hypothetical protein